MSGAKQAIVEAHIQHPSWSAAQIAMFLEIDVSYVRGIVRHQGFSLPRRADDRSLSPARKFKKVKYAGWSGESSW